MHVVSRPALTFAALFALALASTPPARAGGDPGAHWRRYANPAEAGFDPARLDAALAYADSIGSAAVMVVRGGCVVAARGEVDRPFQSASMRKSYLNALLGRAERTGRLRLDRTLAELGIDDLDTLTAAERQATLFDLIRARSGVYHRSAMEPPGMKQRRPARGSHAAGEFHFYNNWDFNVLGYAYEQATGRSLFDAFLDEIARPIGMEDLRRERLDYVFDRSASRYPAYAFRMSARDLARFGQLYLRRGRWNGHDVVPADWIARSWQPHSSVGRGLHYGSLWWVYAPGASVSAPAESLYAARGVGQQMLVIAPGLDLVLVHLADTDFGAGVEDDEVAALFDRILGTIVAPPSADPRLAPMALPKPMRARPPVPAHRRIALAPGVLDRWTGTYASERGEVYRVERRDGFLVVEARGRGQADLRPASPDEFFNDALGIAVRFSAGPDGTASLAVTFRGETRVARRARD